MNTYTDGGPERYYVCPQVANEKMKQAQLRHQTVYLYGISGCGKTSFIKKFFDKKYYIYFTVENLKAKELEVEISSTKTPVVVDDLYLLGEGEQDDLIRQEILKLSRRKDIWLILINRAKVPRWLTPTYLMELFKIIEEKDLYLSKQEIKKYFSLWQLVLTEEDIEKVVKLSAGFGICLRIIAIHLNAREPLDQDYVETMRNEMWDYLEHRVYEKWEPELLEFLLEMCIVDEFRQKLAEMITGCTDSRRMIERAKEVGNFIQEKVQEDREIVYTIHPAMRKSMLRKMERMYSREKKNQLYYNAGMYYELEGDTPNALQMYKKAENNEKISSLIISNIRQNPASGYYYEVRKYYLTLPDETIKESIELMAGMSMLQSILMNIEESERWYQELGAYAVKQTGTLKKKAKSRLIYLDIALPHRGSAGLIEIMKAAGMLLSSKDIQLPEFSVTSNLPSMMNGGKDFCEWSKKDRELAKSIGKLVEMVLGKYGKGMVNLALAESYFEKGESDYEVAAHANKGKMQAEAGGKIEQCFVANGILTWLNVIRGNALEAMELLSSFQKKVEQKRENRLLPNLKALKCRVRMYCEETTEIMKWMQDAPDEEADFCTMDRFQYMTKVRGYLMQSKLEKADGLLQRMLVYSELMKRTYINIEAHLLLAITQYRLKNVQWVQTLTQAVKKAEEYHFVRIISREGAAVWELLQAGKCQFKNNEFIKAVFSETEKMARVYPSYLKEQTGRMDFNENAIHILRLQSEGMSIAQIAEQTGMTVANIKYHCQQTYRKLGVNGKAAAVIEARKRNII